MPSITYDTLAAWSNYHLTLPLDVDHHTPPHLTMNDFARIHVGDIETSDGLERFAETGAALMQYLDRLPRRAKEPLPVPNHGETTNLVGRGWSFSDLIGGQAFHLDCSGNSGIGLADDAYLAKPPETGKRPLAMVGAGTRLREIHNWASRRGWTVETSGTHLGLTIAGSAATASHGSRLGFGGIQDSIVGMHMIVGDKRHVWIERASAPVLSEAGLEALKVNGIPVTPVRSDQRFEDALIHLGAMGIVNGVALRLRENSGYAKLAVAEMIDKDWLREIECGKFGNIAKRLGCKHEPVFYELTIDPQAWDSKPALHIAYFDSERAPGEAAAERYHNALDGMAEYASHVAGPEGLGRYVEKLLLSASTSSADEQEQLPDLAILEALNFLDQSDPPTPAEITQALLIILNGFGTGFDRYAAEGGFKPPSGNFDPTSPNVPSHSWGALHPDEVTGGVPGALYNASFAVPREQTVKAIEAVTDVARTLPGSFVYTLRFVSNAKGTLQFTRFPETTVIEIDGLSPLICRIVGSSIPVDPEKGPGTVHRVFEYLAGILPRAAADIRAQLQSKCVPYSMHWAKLGDLDRAKVWSDYGKEDEGAPSLIKQWQDTRRHLIDDADWMKRFTNPMLARFNLT